MNRLRFIDRMIQGRLTRRQMLQGAAAFGVGALVLPARGARATEAITCLEWSGYDAKEYYPSYMTKRGNAPNFSIFASEEDALQKVRAGFAADVMHPCNYSVGRFLDAKVIEPIDPGKLANWKDLFPSLQTAPSVMKDGNVILAPADWGNTTFTYRTDLVGDEYKGANESWRIFTDEKYAGKVGLTDNFVVLEIAGLLSGYSRSEIFTMSGDKLAAVRPLAEAAVKNARFLWNDPTEAVQGLASGEVVACYSWNDTFKNLTGQGLPVALAKPKEGFFTWYCGLTLLSGGKGDKAAAYDFLDAWLSPETGKYLIEGSGYGHSNVKSFAAADPKAVAAMGFTDPTEHLKSGILFEQEPDEAHKQMIAMWEEIKALKQ